MNNELLATILRHAAAVFEDTPDRLPDEERRFAGIIIDGLHDRSYTLAVCEIRTAGGQPIHAVAPTPASIARKLMEGS